VGRISRKRKAWPEIKKRWGDEILIIIIMIIGMNVSSITTPTPVP